MLRMTPAEYEDHQARVRNLSPEQIRRELEKAVRWSRDKHPDIASAGKMVVKQIGNLLSMDSINRHEPIVIAGRRYDSKSEARRHNILMMREHAGLIRGVRHHPPVVPIIINEVQIATWAPDFEYEEPIEGSAWRKVWEDVKGFTSRKTAKGVTQVNPAWRAFKFKAKILRALYPEVDIRVVTRDKISL